MNKSGANDTIPIFQRLISLLSASVLIAAMLVAVSWPVASAQDATPDDAAQTDVPVSEELAPPDVPEAPAAPEVVATESEPVLPPPTVAPTVVPINIDSLNSVPGPISTTLEPGSTAEFVFAYQVTTPRSSTTIVAEIGGVSGANGAWTIQLQAGGLWSDIGSRVQLIDAQYTGPGSAIPLTLIVTAPQHVMAGETVTLWLSSSVARLDGGVEQGVVASQPVASVGVVPPPTPTPTIAPILDPTMTCAGPAEYSVPLGGKIELTCEVTVLDSRLGAMVVVEPPSGWSVGSGDGQRSTEVLELGPFTADAGVPAVHTVPITVEAPALAGAEGTLGVRLLRDSEARTELDSTTIQLTSIVPDEWDLSCDAGSTPVTPGGSTEISCTLPEAAWALRGDRPTYSYSSAGGWAGETAGAIEGASFSIPLAIPCTVTNEDERLSVSVDLGNGVVITSALTVAIGPSPAAPVPVLTHSSIDFGDAQWLGTAYAPAETTVTLTVSGASSPCASADWSIQLHTSSFSNGELEIDPTISFSTTESTGALEGVVMPSAARTVATGSGNAVIVVKLSLALPASAIAATYTGDVQFSLSTGP